MFSQSPLLKAVNLSIAALLVLLFVAVWWFAWRPLPTVSGELRAPISGAATVVRDELGVPHITAASWQDAVFLQGYTTAQDRLWQMDAMRRAAAGELSEVLGEATIDLDQEARRLRLARIAEAQERALTAEAREILAAYAHGVNYYIETHRDRLPVEFSILRYEPRPWRARDTLLIGMHMYRTLTNSWMEEIRKLHMLQKGDRAKVSFLYPPQLGTDASPGSNAWVIAGKHTASGKPILASDPHLEYALPSLWYMVHLKAPDLDVTGAALPGVPAVIVGHNQRIAWGLTNLEFDMQDLYLEQVDANGATYVHQGRVERVQTERDPLAVKGRDRPMDVVTLVTRHGPLVLSEGGRSYALRWVAAEATGYDFPFLAMNRAQNWEEFNTALARYTGPAQNVVYADADGNIGYHAAGLVPLREGCSGDVPAIGPTESCVWRGFIPYEDLPSMFNPESGVIVSANQNPFPPDYKWPIAGVFASSHRADQIRARLAAKGTKDKWRASDMIAIQRDVYSAILHLTAREVVKAWDAKPGKDEAAAEAIKVLREWNGQMEIGQAAPMVAALTYGEFRLAAAKAAAPGAEENYSNRFATTPIERLLRERPAGWFADYDAVLVESLTKGVAEGIERQGSSVERWDYGQLDPIEIAHPVLSQLPVIGGYFKIGPEPMAGSTTTVKQRTGELGPSYRMAVDFGDLESSVANIVTGQSGHALSRHFSDQWDAYYNGTTFPMQFGKVEAADTLAVRPF